MNHSAQFPCSPNNNLYAKLLQNRFKQTIISARGGGVVEATKRILAQLPISAQSYSNSPYLDLSLYSYDDKWVSIMERPKACGWVHEPSRRVSPILTFLLMPANTLFVSLPEIPAFWNFEFIQDCKIVALNPFDDWSPSPSIQPSRLQSVFNASTVITSSIFIYEIPKQKFLNNLFVADIVLSQDRKCS